MQAAQPDVIVHLAAQAGVCYSLENPAAYIDANLIGTFHLLQAAVQARPRHLLLASTSSDARTPAHGWQPVEGDTLSPAPPWRVVNIGNSQPVRLLDFVDAIEAEIGRPPPAATCPCNWATYPPPGPTPACCSA